MPSIHGRHAAPTRVRASRPARTRPARTSSARKRTAGTKRAAIALTAILTLAGGASAFAYWTTIGSGTGEATTGQSVEFTITTGASVGEIAPGNAGEAIGFTVSNPSAGPLTLSAVAVTLADTTGTAWVPPAGCLIADFTATLTTAPSWGPIAAGGTVTGTATVTLANTGVNQNACQGVTVPLYFAAS
jgi:hypothetical protein